MPRIFIDIALHNRDLLYQTAEREFAASNGGEPWQGPWTMADAVVECLTSGLAPLDCGFEILSNHDDEDETGGS